MMGRLAAPGSHRQSMVNCRNMNVLRRNMNVLSQHHVLRRNMLSCAATYRKEEATSSCTVQLPMPSTDGAI